MLLERVTQAGDVAVTEDREHPGKSGAMLPSGITDF